MASREEAEIQDLLDLSTYLYSKKKEKQKLAIIPLEKQILVYKYKPT